MRLSGYPPSPRNLDEPQPEVCDLCGLHVGGAHLLIADTEGVRGYAVCDVQTGCGIWRSAISYNDRRRYNAREHSTIGDSRIFPPGGDTEWDTG
mgnify:CR=1 FL=1